MKNRPRRGRGALGQWAPRVACLLAIAAAGGLLSAQALGKSSAAREVTTTAPAPDPPPVKKPDPPPQPKPQVVKPKPKPRPRPRVVTPPPPQPPPPPPPSPPPAPPPPVAIAPPPPSVQATPQRPHRAARKAKKRRKHKLHAAASRREAKRSRPAAKKAPHGAVLSANVRVAAPAVTAESGSGTGAISILVSVLLAGSLLLIGAALLPTRVLPPSRLGAIIAHHRADLATAGITGTICLLFAFLIAWMA